VKGLQCAEFGLFDCLSEWLLLADTVEKLDIKRGLFFCNKPKHSDLLTALIV
jgi:hypothetical protein